MWRIVIVSVGFLLLAGCGPKRPAKGVVEGTITYKGQPVNAGSLILYPAGSGGSEFIIPVSQEGVFRTSDVPPGEYKVVVQVNQGGKGPSTAGMSPAKLAEMKEKLDKMKSIATIPIPEKYKSVEKTDLKCTVATGTQTINLVLND